MAQVVVRGGVAVSERSRRIGRLRRATAELAALVCSLTTAACEDLVGPEWFLLPDTVTLYSLNLPEPNLPNAVDLVYRRPVQIERPGETGNWDVALGSSATDLVLLPPGALGIVAKAGVSPVPGVTFDELTEASSDSTAFVFRDAVPLHLGTTYVVLTREATDPSSGVACVFFGKLEPLEIDVTAGMVRLVYDVNPNCNDTRLVP